MDSATADVSVRVAWAEDARAIADLQLRAWRDRYAGVVPADRLPTDVDGAAEAWRGALTRPGDARNRVMVALEHDRLVGFAITSPATDPDCDPVVDAELREFTVDPGARRRGHGSRLLQAVVDTMRADRFNRSVLWLVSTDDDLRGFLTGAGWAADGAHRELELDGDDATRVREVRLHTALA